MSTKTLCAALALTLTAAGSADASSINVLNAGSFVDASGDSSGRVEILNFDAGAIADKVVVQVSGEGGSINSITYNGLALTPVPSTGISRNRGFYTLENPYVGGTVTSGAAQLRVEYNPGTNNGMAMSIVSLEGSASGVSVAATPVASDTITITPTVADSFVFAANVSNSGSGGSSADAPLAQLYGAQIGSSRGAAGYENGVDAVLSDYSFSNVASANRGTSAIAIAPEDDGRTEITDLFATGVDANRVALPTDTIGDPHYTLTSVPTGATTDVRVGSGSDVPGAWLDDAPTSAWIGANGAGGNLNRQPPGFYAAETTFTIGSDADLSTVEIFGSVASDNGLLDILLNGQSVGAPSGVGFGRYTDFSIGPDDPFFQFGVNTLSFEWNNAGSNTNPGGLRIGYLTGSYLLVPEPTSLVVGMLGLSALATRRRRSSN